MEPTAPLAYYLSDGQQQSGPYTLHDIAALGGLHPQWLAWRQGMPQWLPVAHLPELRPYLHPATRPAPATVAAPPRAHARVPFGANSVQTLAGLFFVLMSLSVLAATGAIAVSMGWASELYHALPEADPANMTYDEYMTRVSERAAEASRIVDMLVWGMVLTLIVALVLWLVLLYRAWVVVQPAGQTNVRPAQAVGLLFVPFYNLYWMFVAIAHLPKAMNIALDHYQVPGPRMNPALGFGWCITLLVALVPLAGLLAVPVWVVFGILLTVQMQRAMTQILRHFGQG